MDIENTIKHLKAKNFTGQQLDFAIEALEKQMPKRPIGVSSTHDGRVGNCPSCKRLVHESTKDMFGRKINICLCGQKLNWN